MSSKVSRFRGRERRQRRVRKTVRGTAARPRLSVFRSLRHIYAQLIDDEARATLAAASTLDADLRDEVSGCNKDSARKVGLAIAAKAKAAGIEQVVFDRNGYVYHGCVQAVADGAREGELRL
ncbi:MAG: 50S ribosomal protein L18 [Armatimonadetes bacterium]|nr:50S ribosomal protein L18 [Armatimonadota bacterium]